MCLGRASRPCINDATRLRNLKKPALQSSTPAKALTTDNLELASRNFPELHQPRPCAVQNILFTCSHNTHEQENPTIERGEIVKKNRMGRREISDALDAYGFVRINEVDENSYEGWKLISRDFIVYVKPSDEDPLVIDPRHEEKLEVLLRMPGVTPSNSHIIHSTHFSNFKKRQNKGKSPINYGLDFGFSTRTNLNGFLDYLIGADHLPHRTAQNDIDIVAGLPSDPTELQAVILARRGQGKFRSDLIAEWTTCQATGCSNPALLRASHIKPWRSSNNTERTSSDNGLLLSANLDAAFDVGLISFDEAGQILIAESLSSADAASVGIHAGIRINFRQANIPYLSYHRQMVWRGTKP